MNREAGTALPVVAAILVGVGLIVTGYTYLRSETRETRQETSATPSLERVADQIAAFARVNKRLPAPADAQSSTGIEDSTTPASRAMVPWRTLGLDGAADPWGRMISYRAYTPATAPNSLTNGSVTATQGMEVCSPSGCETGVGFVVFSHGLAGRGGFNSDGTLAAATTAGSREAGNVAVTGANGQQMFAWTRTSPTDTDEPFDHILEWRPLSALIVSPGTGGQPCIPSSLFAGGLAATGDGGITLRGNPQINLLPSSILTTKVLTKPGNWYRPDLMASGTTAEKFSVPAPPPNSCFDAGDSDPCLGDLKARLGSVVRPSISESSDLKSIQLVADGELFVNSNGTLKLNVRNDITASGGTKLNINGNSYVFSENMHFSAGSKINTSPNSTIIFVLSGDLKISGGVIATPSTSQLIFLVDGDVDLNGGVKLSASIYAGGELKITGGSELSGEAVASAITMDNGVFTYRKNDHGGSVACP